MSPINLDALYLSSVVPVPATVPVSVLFILAGELELPITALKDLAIAADALQIKPLQDLCRSYESDHYKKGVWRKLHCKFYVMGLCIRIISCRGDKNCHAPKNKQPTEDRFSVGWSMPPAPWSESGQFSRGY